MTHAAYMHYCENGTLHAFFNELITKSNHLVIIIDGLESIWNDTLWAFLNEQWTEDNQSFFIIGIVHQSHTSPQINDKEDQTRIITFFPPHHASQHHSDKQNEDDQNSQPFLSLYRDIKDEE